MLLRVAVHVKLLDALDGELLVLERELVRVGGETLGKVGDGLGEGGGEEDVLDRAGEEPRRGCQSCSLSAQVCFLRLSAWGKLTF